MRKLHLINSHWPHIIIFKFCKPKEKRLEYQVELENIFWKCQKLIILSFHGEKLHLILKISLNTICFCSTYISKLEHHEKLQTMIKGAKIRLNNTLSCVMIINNFCQGTRQKKTRKSSWTWKNMFSVRKIKRVHGEK